MNEYRNGSATGNSDNHPGITVDYWWHASFGGHEIAGWEYQFSGAYNFNAQNGGFANLGIVLSYRIGSTGDKVPPFSTVAPESVPALTITY